MHHINFESITCLFAFELRRAICIVTLALGIKLTLFKHVMERAQKAEQSFAHDKDSVGEGSHDVKPQVPVIKTLVAFFLSKLCGVVA